MIQNREMVLPETFVDMNDTEIGYVGGIGEKELINQLQNNPNVDAFSWRSMNSHSSSSFFYESSVKENTYHVMYKNGTDELITATDTYKFMTNRGRNTLIAGGVVLGAAAVTCTILAVCGVFNKD